MFPNSGAGERTGTGKNRGEKMRKRKNLYHQVHFLSCQLEVPFLLNGLKEWVINLLNSIQFSCIY